MAQRIPEAVIDKIRQSVDIVDVIGQYVDLQKRGKNYFGLCPFHDENTPSFTVEAEAQFFKCFSCGRGGNVFSFLMELEGYSFVEAVQQVQEIGNVAIDYEFQTDEATPALSEMERQLLQVHREATQFYHYLLTATKAGEAALRYLHKRGLSDETIATFQIGLAPKERGMTYDYLINKGFTAKPLVASGIFVGNEQKSDRFFDRIMFPLRNEQGQTIAFSGRIWRADASTDQAKYLNSPETPLFEKNRFLFNLDQAKGAARREKELILFEGFMDVIKASEVGVKTGVASLGTSLTSHQIQLLFRYTKQLVVAYDGDQPGFKATKRAVENIRSLTPHQALKVVLFPEGLDPDEFVERHGAERFLQFLNQQRLSVMQFYRAYYRQEYSLDNDDGKLNYIKAMLGIVSQEHDLIKRDVYLQDISEDTGVKPEVLAGQLTMQPTASPAASPSWEKNSPRAEMLAPTEQKTYTLMQRAELQLFHRLLKSPETWDILALEQETFTFQTSIMQTLYLLLASYRQEHEDIIAADFYSTLAGEPEREWFQAAEQLPLPETCTRAEIKDLLSQITIKSHLKEEIERLTDAINTAKLTNDIMKMGSLNQKRIEILRELKDNR
ncbi:MAG: DNA primase [Aerococcus sp.]|nr:DNA primase [Aerococcus sp.]